jgi:hypothetical protein
MCHGGDAWSAHAHGMDYPVVHSSNTSAVTIMNHNGRKGAQSTGTKWRRNKRNNIFQGKVLSLAWIIYCHVYG